MYPNTLTRSGLSRRGANKTPEAPVEGDWILATGEWNDSGVWDDTADWVDSI